VNYQKKANAIAAAYINKPSRKLIGLYDYYQTMHDMGVVNKLIRAKYNK
jgi:hypothetical protein